VQSTRAHRCKLRTSNDLHAQTTKIAHRLQRPKLDAAIEAPGTTSFSEVVPEVVLCCWYSGDVNQGGEMQVLARELDALNASMIAFECVGDGM
jgi:hypothetical protein